MYLKRLEIKGFKSFADHTELNLNPGINIIVGPNGCGKSNIVDAVRWVLGEANVRHLRGQKNEDVIFNGTDKRRALGMAQVDMTVDNEERSLALDFGEITVSRKIYRSGESEFFLNKSRVRMKDISRLYMDTGLGKRGYSIISQGELERVLNGQPLDRRLMLEEAAGTIKYRQQRDEVGQRILATAQDLVRVQDILLELGNREAELHYKADKAKAYLALREELTHLEKQLLAFQIKEAIDNLEQKNAELTSEQERIGVLTTEQAQIESSLRQAETELVEQNAAWQSLKDERYATEAVLNTLDSEMKLSQERINNYRERIISAADDSEKYAHMLKKLETDLQTKKDDLAVQQNLFIERQHDLQALVFEIDNLRIAAEEKEALFEEQSRLVFERVNQESKLKNEIAELEHNIRKAQERKERLTIRNEETDGQMMNSQKRAADLKEQKRRYDRLKKEWEKAILAAEGNKNKNCAAQNSLAQEADNISKEIVSLEHKLLALQELKKSYAGFSEGVRGLFKAYDRGDQNLRGIIGLIADLIEIPATIELAIDTAVGRAYENIVVESHEAAQQAIWFLKQQRLGRVTFLPLDVLRVQKIPQQVEQEFMSFPGVVGIAAKLVHYESKYEKAVDYLLARVLLVQKMEDGIKIFKKIKYPLRIVSLDGELISTNGAITGGILNPSRTSPIQRNREEKVINQQLIKLNQAKEINIQAAAQLAEEIQADDYKLSQGKNGLAEVEFQLKIIGDEEARLQNTIDTARTEQDSYRREIGQLENLILESQQTILDLQKHHRTILAQNNSLTDTIEKTKLDLENNRREFEVRKERYSSHLEQLEMKQIELENLAKNIAQFEQVGDSYRQSSSDAHRLKERLQIEVDLHTKRIKVTHENMAVQNNHLDRISSAIESTHREVERVDSELVLIRESLIPLRQRLTDHQDRCRALEMKMVRQETEKEGLLNQWTEKFGEGEAAEAELASPRQIRGFRTRVEELRDQIEALGSIDIEAIKEYDEVKARYDFLQLQTKDLTAAKISLESLLQETERIMGQNFAQFIDLANASFNKTFTEIFNGGDASLEIESLSDLAAGVDIVVKMPGKRSQSLNLLSGGERALTCIAFIFSLLRLKPAPFCLLDEIDASLDETNLIRFTDFLRAMAADTQFIVITHRQATIESGSNIYGITMPQEGISSILSIRGDEIETLAG